MNPALDQITNSTSFGLFLTVGSYAMAARLQKRLGGTPLLHPVLVGSCTAALVLWAFHIPVEHFRHGADMIHILLGPATVALAVPLYRQVSRIRSALVPVLGSVLVGSIVASSSAVLVARWLGATKVISLSLAPKSVTTPIAMAVAEAIGGDPGLAALAVVATGILGAIAGAGFFKLLRIKDARAIGLGFGVASHGVGTSRAIQLGETEGAFSSLAMGLAGFLTAILLPIAVRLFG